MTQNIPRDNAKKLNIAVALQEHYLVLIDQTCGMMERRVKALC